MPLSSISSCARPRPISPMREAWLKIAHITAERWKGCRTRTPCRSRKRTRRSVSPPPAEAKVQAAQANLQRLRELSGFKKIVAPFDGVVTARNTDVGQLITGGIGSGPELFRIADTHQLRLYVCVPQAYAATDEAEPRC